MKIPVPVFLAIAALSIAALSCATEGTTSASLSISASPSTFKSVGETITFTYTVDAIDYITRSKSQGVTDNAADATPSCSVSNDGKQLICKATHTITTEDVALGYVTSSATFRGYISPSIGGAFPVPSGNSEYFKEEATTVVYIENFTPSPTPTTTPLSSPTPMVTVTPTLTVTPASTLTATPVASLDGEVQAEKLACRYGPGDLYLYQFGLIQGNKMQVLGRDIHSEWVYVQVQGYDSPCWVNPKYINMNGDIASLESVYPGKVNIPLSYYWPAPKNVYAARTADGKQVGIYWDEYILPDGEMESPDSPRYLAELWLCKDGKLTFTSVFAWQNNLLVDDEAGCSEPSSGVMYLVEKHGYSGPVTIPWPAP